MFYLKQGQCTRTTFHHNFISMFFLLVVSLFATSVDAAAPTVSITSPSNNAALKVGTITVNGISSDDNRVSKVEAYMVLSSSINTPYQLVANTGKNYSTWSTTFNITTAGTYKITARATDRGGYSTLDTITVTVTVPDTTAPNVSISPTSGTYTTAQTVTLTASASDNVGISKVEFYDGGVLKATEIYSPYTYGWAVSSAINGTHNWTAKAYDAAGNSKVSTAVSLTVNVPIPDTTMPSVSISSPASGTTYTTAQTVTITALASDNVGVSKVEFYDGGVLKSTDTTSPYNHSWSVSSSDNGTHSWTAKAYDAAGNSKVSAAAGLTVNVPISDTTAPSVSISPASGTYTAAQTVTLGASASDNVGVSKVEFYDGGVLKGTDTTSPYNHAWSVSSSDNGTHSWTAKAYDAAGNSKVSTAVSLTVNVPVPDTTVPSVSISSPASGTTYTTAQTVTITALASDNVGVSKVEFYDGGVLKGTDTTSPYNHAWVISSAINGTHSWTAKAYDAAGNSKVSATINLSVNVASSSVFDDFNDGPYELFDGEYSPNGKWKNSWNGRNDNGENGKSGVKVNAQGNKVFYQLQPAPIGDSTATGGTTSGTTSGQVLSVANDFKNYKLSLDVRTLKSMRTNHNAWEVAWIFFRFVDRSKHYYFYVGYNGWELGKKDVNLLPDGSIDREEQRFLGTGNNVKLQLGVWQHWDIEVVGNNIKVFVDGVKLVDLYDDGTRVDFQGTIPAMCNTCYQGHIGMYNEDADVEYENITITPL